MDTVYFRQHLEGIQKKNSQQITQFRKARLQKKLEKIKRVNHAKIIPCSSISELSNTKENKFMTDNLNKYATNNRPKTFHGKENQQFFSNRQIVCTSDSHKKRLNQDKDATFSKSQQKWKIYPRKDQLNVLCFQRQNTISITKPQQKTVQRCTAGTKSANCHSNIQRYSPNIKLKRISKNNSNGKTIYPFILVPR